MIELGRTVEARVLFEAFKRFAKCELETEAEIDYFATSLPLLLVFEDDLNERKQREGEYLLRQAKKGLQQCKK